jgi:hypothetical protein
MHICTYICEEYKIFISVFSAEEEEILTNKKEEAEEEVKLSPLTGHGDL